MPDGESGEAVTVISLNMEQLAGWEYVNEKVLAERNVDTQDILKANILM